MLRKTVDLEGYAIATTDDGVLGKIKDFYFDDKSWVIRYLVVETGAWFASHKVLISPIALGNIDEANGDIHASLTQEQIRNSPSIDSDKPVSRQHEVAYFSYFGYPYYWGGADIWGSSPTPNALMENDTMQSEPSSETEPTENNDPHLRSCHAVKGYHLHATDGDIGHVTGYLVSDETWAIRYLIVNTSLWWHGHEVLIPISWIDSVNWGNSTVAVNVSRQTIKDAPTSVTEQ